MMQWTYDREAVDEVSVTAFRYLLEDHIKFSPIEDQKPSWLRIWSYSLLDSDITLMIRMEELLAEAQEIANLRREIFTYSLATKYLIKFTDFVEHMNITNDLSVTMSAENASLLNSESDFFVNYGNGGRHVLEKRIQHITSCIITILNQWQLKNNIMIAQVREINLYFTELQEMWNAEMHLFDYDTTSNLRMKIIESCNSASDILNDLSIYAVGVYRTVTYSMYISFFEQLNQFIQYSISELETFSDTSFSKTLNNTKTNSSTGVVTNSTENSYEVEHKGCNESDSLYCVVRQLVADLKETQDSCCVVNFDHIDTSIIVDKVIGVGGIEVTFEYRKVRTEAYDLWKIIASRDFSLDNTSEVLHLLKEAQQITGDLTEKLITEADMNDQSTTTTGKPFTPFVQLLFICFRGYMLRKWPHRPHDLGCPTDNRELKDSKIF